MKNKNPLTLSLQIYSAFLVALGIYLLYKSGVSTFIAIQEGQYSTVLLGLFVLGISLALFFVSYETVFKFSSKSISDLSEITGLFVYLLLIRLLKNIDSDSYVFLIQLVIVLAPYAIGFYSYRIMKNTLVKFAIKRAIIQPATPPDPRASRPSVR